MSHLTNLVSLNGWKYWVGMVHHNVLKAVDVDPEVYSGYTFGRIDRLPCYYNIAIFDRFTIMTVAFKAGAIIMFVSYRWLSEYCKCPDDINTLISRLNRIGFEVESVQKKGEGLSIFGGAHSIIEQHPDADRLRIAQVDIGTSVTQIVTTADNVNEGDKIQVVPGAVLASGKIKQSKLQGVESNGMMCSAVECGLTDTAPGVWVLPKDVEIGADFVELAQLNVPF